MKYRHELKYQINSIDCSNLRSKLRYVMKLDPNAGPDGNYIIRSLYFDNPEDKALMEKIAGVDNRTKYRMRFYNYDDSYIVLEKKMKVKSLTAKLSEPITKEQCIKIIEGDIEWLRSSEKALLRELYQKMKHEQFKPKTIVDYVREAYIFKAGNVRVTFDKSVSSGLKSTDFLNKDLPTAGTLNCTILEIKYDAFLPEIINDIIQVGNRSRLSVSKYALCRMYD